MRGLDLHGELRVLCHNGRLCLEIDGGAMGILHLNTARQI